MQVSSAEETLTIGQLARKAGVGIETIRYYEREGLIETATRSAAGYRLFHHNVVDRFGFIKRSRDLGFTLKEIKELLNMSGDKQSTAGEFKNLAENKIEQINEKIANLEAMRNALQKLTSCCPGGNVHTKDCPILAALKGLSL